MEKKEPVMKRDLYWDTLKFIMIFFVVYGHTISGFGPDGSFNRAMYNFIYSFHMPLFVFISGRFSHIRDVDKYKRGLLRILETYIVFQLIRSFMPILYGRSLTLNSIVDFLLMPENTLWYLLCLVYWRMLVMFIPQSLLKRPILLLVLCFAVSIMGGFILVNILSIQRAMTFLPFFFMGYYSTAIDCKQYLGKIHIGIPIVFIISLFTIVYYFLNFDINFVHHGKCSYWSQPLLSPFILCIARCLYILVAILLSIMMMRLIRVQPFLAKMGGATLVVYMYHFFITQSINILGKQGILPYNNVLLFIYAVVITIGLAYASRFKIVTILLNPVSYMTKKSNN